MGLAEKLTGERMVVSVHLSDGGRVRLIGDGVDWESINACPAGAGVSEPNDPH